MYLLLFLFLSVISSVTFAQETRGFGEFMDPSINPCEDFYEYSCGNWTPLNTYSMDVLADQRKYNQFILRTSYEILHQDGIHDEHPPSRFYYLCGNSHLQPEERILSQYLRIFIEYSGWPSDNHSFTPDAYDWLQVAAKLRRHQIDTFFELSIQRHWKNSEEHVVQLSALEKSFDGPADGIDASAYKNYVRRLILALGLKAKKANRLAQQLIDFETELNSLSREAKDSLDKSISLDNLIEQLPQLNWRLYFETLLSRPVNGSQPVVLQIDLFRELEKLIGKTETEVISLYQLTKYLRHYRVKMDQPDWDDCIDELNEKMPLSVADDFEALTPTYNSYKVWKVYENLQEEFIEQINGSSWHDAKLKAEIIDRLELLRAFIGISDVGIQLDEESEIDMENYQQARVELEKLAAKNEFAQLQFEVKEAIKHIKPLNVDAHYESTLNALEVPIGLLLPPLFRAQSTSAQLMGSLGTIFARELVKGFGYVSAKQDPNLKPNCLKSQNNRRQDDEDILDSEGLHLAYSSYEKMADDGETKADTMFSGKQLFFISYAQIWCQTKEGLESSGEDHSSHKDRVNNVMANSEKFADAFSCPSGSKLNSATKC